MVQWLDYCTANLQVVGSNMIHNYIFVMLSLRVVGQPYVPELTSAKPKQLESTLPTLCSISEDQSTRN